MTPDKIAKEITDNDDWYEWCGEGYYIKPETLAMHIAAAIREAEVRGVGWGIAYCESALEASGQIIRFARDPAEVAEKARQG